MTKTGATSRILVTGASGRVGKFLRRAWQDQTPGEVIWLSRQEPADILWSPGAVLPHVPPCDTVIALWGRTSGTAAELSVNVDLVAQTQRLALACGASRVLHCSSAAVYGPGVDLTEISPCHPTTDYGVSKCKMESAVDALSSSSSAPRHCCLRLANVVGADSLSKALRPGTTPAMLDRFADGNGPIRSYVAPSDLARVLAALSRLPPDALPPCLNVTAPVAVAMEDLLRAAGREISWREAGPHATQTVTLDGGRLVRLLQFRYLMTTAEQMIDDLNRLEAMT